MNNNLKETRKSIMSRAHEICREMRNKGFEFDYHVQLGLNIKYLWETVGETVDTMMEEEIPADTAIEETVVEDTVEEIEVEEEPMVEEEYDEEEEYDKYEEYVEYVVKDTEEEEEEEIVENTEDNSEYKLGEKFEEHECTEAFCGSCLMDTLQYREGGEVVCTECGERWELIPYEEYKVLNKYAQFTEDEEEIEIEEQEEDECDYTLECISHITLPNDAGHSFLFKLYLEDTVQEFVAYANKNHRLPIVFDANPNDIELLEKVKAIINDEVHIYNSIENDYVPDYRYTRGEDYFIYFDEVANIFKGYYCGNEIYGGRAFTFDINSKEGPCSRAIRQLIKDHKAGNFGKYTTMNGKGTTITKWRDKILEECRALYKLSKNNTKIQEAKAVMDKPWLHDEVRVNAAIRFLAQMNVEHEFKYESYNAAIDAKLRNLAETYDPSSKFNKLSDKLIAKYQDRIHQLGLTNLYRDNTKANKQPAQSKGDVTDEFADFEF